MLPIGPLMIEHRLIEKMIGVMRNEIRNIEERHQTDPVLIDQVVDFIRTYADRTHHGKEEGILFRDLVKKDLAEQDQRVMLELIEEHKYGRSLVKGLVEAKERYLQGKRRSLEGISGRLNALVEFYPAHIKKEDKDFFLAAMKYFSRQEQEAMLQEMWAFDRSMIHQKYKALVEQLQS